MFAHAARARVVHITLALSKHASAPRAPAVEQAGARRGTPHGRSHRLQQSRQRRRWRGNSCATRRYRLPGGRGAECDRRWRPSSCCAKREGCWDASSASRHGCRHAARGDRHSKEPAPALAQGQVQSPRRGTLLPQLCPLQRCELLYLSAATPELQGEALRTASQRQRGGANHTPRASRRPPSLLEAPEACAGGRQPPPWTQKVRRVIR